jgi:membrane protein YdbS with pleckstrin-like domain
MDVLQGLIEPSDPTIGGVPVFENLPVHPKDLPQLKEVEYHPLSKEWLRWQFRRNAVAYAIGMLAVVALILFQGWSMWFIVPLSVLSLLFVFAQSVIRKSYLARRYALRERDITFQRGWIWWSETAIPFNRIQHCEIEQGPIEKMYGLATLEVYTAGKNSSDVSIGGLERPVAERLKDFILGRIQQESDEEE